MEISFGLYDVVLVLPVIVLFLSSLFPLTIKVLRGNKELNPNVTLLYGLAGVVGAGILVMSSAPRVLAESTTAFSGALVFDGVGTTAAILVLGALFFTLLYSRESLAQCGDQYSEQVFLMMNSAIGMLLLAWSSDLIMVFISIELMSLCLYILIALSQEQSLSKEAAFKYFVLGSFASAVFLYGVAFIYGTVGSVQLPVIKAQAAELISYSRLFLMGIVLAILGFCFKVAIVPFHSWAPDVYEGSPTTLTGYMATAVKVVSFVAFLRLITTNPLMGVRAESLVDVLQWLAVLTMMVGNIAAIVQKSFKRMLAYSSVAHSGYVMIALIASGIGGSSILGATGVMYYVLAYTIMTVGAFGAISLFETKYDTRLMVEDLKGLASSRPWTAIFITIFMFSLAGVPPTIGFFGKFYIFSAAVKQGLLWLAFWGVISSVISVYYYLRPVVMMYMNEPGTLKIKDASGLSQFGVAFSAVLVILGGLIVEPVFQYVYKSVQQLF